MDPKSSITLNPVAESASCADASNVGNIKGSVRGRSIDGGKGPRIWLVPCTAEAELSANQSFWEMSPDGEAPSLPG